MESINSGENQNEPQRRNQQTKLVSGRREGSLWLASNYKGVILEYKNKRREYRIDIFGLKLVLENRVQRNWETHITLIEILGKLRRRTFLDISKHKCKYFTHIEQCRTEIAIKIRFGKSQSTNKTMLEKNAKDQYCSIPNFKILGKIWEGYC